jgi:hypothetical protein
MLRISGSETIMSSTRVAIPNGQKRGEPSCAEQPVPPATYGDIDRATTLATMSDVAFALAVAGAGLGVYGLFSTPKADRLRA